MLQFQRSLDFTTTTTTTTTTTSTTTAAAAATTTTTTTTTGFVKYYGMTAQGTSKVAYLPNLNTYNSNRVVSDKPELNMAAAAILNFLSVRILVTAYFG